jgi:hypothetical protein
VKIRGGEREGGNERSEGFYCHQSLPPSKWDKAEERVCAVFWYSIQDRFTVTRIPKRVRYPGRDRLHTTASAPLPPPRPLSLSLSLSLALSYPHHHHLLLRIGRMLVY